MDAMQIQKIALDASIWSLTPNYSHSIISIDKWKFLHNSQSLIPFKEKCFNKEKHYEIKFIHGWV